MIREEKDKIEHKCVYREIDRRASEGLGYALTPELTRKLIESKLSRMQQLRVDRNKVIETSKA